jgi:uncharacterized protein DUF6946
MVAPEVATMIYVPAAGPDAWRALLADPETPWRAGQAAPAWAERWQSAHGFPEAVRDVLDGDERFVGAQMLLGWVEPKVAAHGGRAQPAPPDLFVLAKLADRSLTAIAVTGTVAEPLGETVAAWLGGAPSPNRMERLQFLLDTVGIAVEAGRPLQYQLLQRTASALLEAQRYNAAHALLLVHSFGPNDAWLDEYAQLAHALGGTAQRQGVITIGDRAGVLLHLAWVKDAA